LEASIVIFSLLAVRPLLFQFYSLLRYYALPLICPHDSRAVIPLLFSLHLADNIDRFFFSDPSSNRPLDFPMTGVSVFLLRS